MNIVTVALAVAIGIKLAPHLGGIGRGILWVLVGVGILTAGSLFLRWYDSTRLGTWLNSRVIGQPRY